MGTTHPRVHVEAATLAGGDNNQDRYAYGDGWAFVLDGATTYSDTPPIHDGGWYAERLKNALSPRLDQQPGRPTIDIVADSIREAASAHHPSQGPCPTSTITLVRWDAEQVEIYVLGDSCALALTDYGPVLVSDQRLRRVGTGLRTEYRRRLRRGHGFDPRHTEILAALQGVELAHRNRDRGYWIAGDDPRAAAHAQTSHISMHNVESVYLYSDGVKLDDAATPSNARRLATTSTRALIQALDDVERWDHAGASRPRSKRHDDKTIISITRVHKLMKHPQAITGAADTDTPTRTNPLHISGAQLMQGLFWTPVNGAAHSAFGVLHLDGRNIKLEVIPPIVDDQSLKMSTVDSIIRFRGEGGETIHGSCVDDPRRLTLLGANAVGVTTVLNPFEVKDEVRPERQTIEADWALLGANVESDAFEWLTLDIEGLTQWSNLPTHTESYTIDRPTQFEVKVEASHSLESGFVRGARIRAIPNYTVKRTSHPGVALQAPTHLSIQPRTPMGIELLFRGYALPIATLMTLITGQRCLIHESKGQVNGQRVAVAGHHIRRREQRTTCTPLVTADQAGHNLLANWIELEPELTPIPQIVAAALADEMPTVENTFLQLATAAEGCGRILNDGKMRFTSDDLEQARKEINQLQIHPDLRDSLVRALTPSWAEPSFPMKLQLLADSTSLVIPELIGTPSRWKREISRLRNSLAHGALGSSDREIEKLKVMSVSLTWALRIQLLMFAHVQTSQLRSAVLRSTQYALDRRLAVNIMPRIFN